MNFDTKHFLMIIVRHGRTKLNAMGYFRGESNPPLDSVGWKQAHKLSYFLEPIEFFPIVLSSDKLRAKQTAEVICEKRPDCHIQYTSDLNALDVGKFSGQPRTEQSIQELHHYIKNPNIPIPEGSGSLNDFKNRVRPVFKEALEVALNQGQPILIIGHSSIVHEAGDVFANDHTHALVEPGGVAAVYISKGRLGIEPIFRPKSPEAKKEDVVS
jgi:broad specificity phosphatase PhoE